MVFKKSSPTWRVRNRPCCEAYRGRSKLQPKRWVRSDGRNWSLLTILKWLAVDPSAFGGYDLAILPV